MVSTYIGLAAAAFAALYGIIIYNGLVNLKHGIGKAWSNIDILLVQRHSELPKLVETCKQYMQFERETLTQVMAARSAADGARQSGDVKGVGAAQAALSAGLGKITATVEAYPELRANQSIQHLLGPSGALDHLTATQQATLTGHASFPHLIAGPFHTGLVIVFVTGAVLGLVSALASLLRGGHTVNLPD